MHHTMHDEYILSPRGNKTTALNFYCLAQLAASLTSGEQIF